MGKENKLFLRLCDIQRDAGAPCICARAVCGYVRFAGGLGIRPYGGGGNGHGGMRACRPTSPHK